MNDVTIHFICKMAAVQNAVNTAKENLEKWLDEKNFFTDALTKVEEKTKVKKLYIFLGSYQSFSCFKTRFCQLPLQAIFLFVPAKNGWIINRFCCRSCRSFQLVLGIRLWSRFDRDSSWFCLSSISIVSKINDKLKVQFRHFENCVSCSCMQIFLTFSGPKVKIAECISFKLSLMPSFQSESCRKPSEGRRHTMADLLGCLWLF